MSSTIENRRLIRVTAICTIAAMLLTGCEKKEPEPTPAAIEDTIERGPISLTMTVSPTKPLVGDELTITLRFIAPADYEPTFPPATAFTDLDAERGNDEPSSLNEDGSRVWVAKYRVPTFTAGPLEIPALAVAYGKRSAAANANTTDEIETTSELVTEPQTIEIVGVLTTQDTADHPRDISGILAPPPKPLDPRTVAMYAAIGLGALAVLVGLFIWLRRMLIQPAPPIPAHEWALHELNSLSATDAAGRDQIKAIYYRVSEIVREYIERRFNIAAPDMTTEEFLRATATRRRSALPFDPNQLAPFLEQCDIVKYAAYEAMPEDAANTIATAQDFVRATARTPEQQGAAA